MPIYNDQLYHHGVKGMKWGVRKDKGYSYSINKNGDFVLKKGSNIKRMTDDKNEKNEGSEYASFTKRDTEMYKRDFITWLSYKPEHKADVTTFQMTQKLTKDLVAPSDVTKVRTVLKMLDADHKLASEINNICEVNMSNKQNDIDRMDGITKRLCDKGYPKNIATVYSAFSMGLYYSPKLRDKFFKELSDNNYNMVIDTEDAIGYAQAPIIVFNRGDSLKMVKINEMPKVYSEGHRAIQYKNIERDNKLDKSLKGFN